MCAAGLLGVPAVPAYGADAQVHIGYPAEGQAVGTGPLTVTGSVQVGAGTMTQVIYAVDVSGSTASPAGLDCNGDGSVTAALDDYNQDGSVGDTLDCEISGIVSLNAALRAVPDADARIRVGVVGFGSLAARADMDPGTADTAFVKPGDTRDGNDVIPRVNAVAGSLTRGTIGLETLYSVGTGTDFQQPLDVAAAAFAADANKWIFLVSDGQASIPDTSRLAAAGIKVRTFAVGAAATCQAGSPLDVIATGTGDACVRVDDPSRLRSDIVSGTPSGIRSVTAQLDGNAARTATVDAIGNYSVAVGDVGTGAHTVTVRVELADGTRLPDAVRRFTGTAGTRYVAIGDSFSAGEGVEPYVDQKVDRYLNAGRGARIPLYQQNPAFLCHRSTKGWPLKIKEPGASKPVADSGGAFTFAACSGARLVNVDTTQQPKEYRDKKTAIPLQNTVLGTDADLVTMTFGGNDVGFVPIVTHCVAHYDCWEDTFVTVNGTPVSLDNWTKIRIALVQNELDGLYQQVRGRVRTDTRIVVATYPRLLKIGNRICTEGVVLPQGERQWLADRVDDFDDVVAVRAARSNIDVADVRDAFQDHAICDGDNYITGARAARATDLGGGVSAASFHPNDKGTTAYATVVSGVLAKPASTAPLALTGKTADPGTGGAATGAKRVAAPSAAAVEAAAKAEAAATAGPARTTVSSAVQTPKAVQVRQLAPAGGPGDAVLARYPAEVVAAVAATGFTDLVVGDGAAMKLMPSCPSDVVPGEYVPFSAPGFAPGSTVQAQVAWEGATPAGTTVTADAAGRARGWIRVPADVPVDRPAALRVSGKGPSGGAVLGYAPLTATAAADCRQLVVDAGLLTEPAGPPASGPDESTPGEGATTSAPPRAGGPLPTTGPGGWLLISAAVGAVMVLAGAGLLFVVRRRRAADA